MNILLAFINSNKSPATASNTLFSFINSFFFFSCVSTSLYLQSHLAVNVFKSKSNCLHPSSHKFVFT